MNFIELSDISFKLKWWMHGARQWIALYCAALENVPTFDH